MIKIKICGITNLEDAIMASEMGADAIGFIFAPSKRMVSPQLARSIIERLPPFITTVGIFMNTPLTRVNKIVKFTKIDVVQAHGDETQEYCNAIACPRVIKRINTSVHSSFEDLIKQVRRFKVSGLLLDPGEGSGRTFDWNRIKGIGDYAGNIIVAGGLTTENVRQVIKILRPYGVDVCSGVEKTPGKKDPNKLKKFISEVRLCSSPV
ncbi:MAG: phosphoribosylanthranilate isomerase [bacterium]